MGDSELLYGDGMPYEWGNDWPETFDLLSMAKQNRPLSKVMSPLSVMEELNKVFYSARPRPNKPGGKPLAAPTHEKEQETESRKKCQKESSQAHGATPHIPYHACANTGCRWSTKARRRRRQTLLTTTTIWLTVRRGTIGRTTMTTPTGWRYR